MNAIQTTFSLLFVIRKYQLLKNGEASIYLRITVNDEVADITAKCNVSPEMWDQRRECSLGKLHKEEFESKIERHDFVYRNYSAMSKSMQKQFIGFYFEAKKEDTRKNRLEKIIALLEQNKRLM